MSPLTLVALISFVNINYILAEDDFFVRRCSADNSQTTCGNRFVGPTGNIEISTFDIQFDFDDPSVCTNDNNVATSSVPITQDADQGPVENEYNVIQTNLNCFGGYRGIEPSCENDYTVWFPGEGSDNPNGITGPRMETSVFPATPCFIPDGCPETPTHGDNKYNANFAFNFAARGDYICANLNADGYFLNENLFLTTCSLSSSDGDLSLNLARVEELDGDTFGGTTKIKTLKYGSFLDEDCSFGLPDDTKFDITKDCIAGIVEHHGSFRGDDHALTINGVNDIFVEFRGESNFNFVFRNRVKVKFLCGDFKDIKYKAYRCIYNGPADDNGDGSSLRYHQFTKNECNELKNIDKLNGKNTALRPNLGPRGGDCLAFLRRYRQCGDDYNYRVLNEGDDLGTISNFGPGVAWQLNDSLCQNICNGECDDVDIEVDFLCPLRRNPRRKCNT